MASLKSLAKDTAIYGMSSIVGRFLNYLLFPLYTHVFAAASGGNGVITNMYSYTALLFVILTFGMETTLFRFINRDDVEDPKKVYTTVSPRIVTPPQPTSRLDRRGIDGSNTYITRGGDTGRLS